MGKALFIGLSFAFLTGYSLVATALFVPASTLTPIGDVSELDCSDSGIVFPGDPCYKQETAKLGWLGDLLGGASDILDVTGQMFSGFWQLVTFQTGYSGASFLTLLIFTPLGAINAYIIFTAVRGGS